MELKHCICGVRAAAAVRAEVHLHCRFTTTPREAQNEFLQSLRKTYTAKAYSLFHNNCNNFTNEFSVFLTGAGIPVSFVPCSEDAVSQTRPAFALYPCISTLLKTTMTFVLLECLDDRTLQSLACSPAHPNLAKAFCCWHKSATVHTRQHKV